MLFRSATAAIVAIGLMLCLPISGHTAISPPTSESCSGSIVDGTCYLGGGHHDAFSGAFGDYNTFGVPALVCPVDDSPYRVQVIYAYEQDNRLSEARDEIESAVAGAQRLFDVSSASHGAAQSLVPRFNGSISSDRCKLNIEAVHMPEGYSGSSFETGDSLSRRGFADMDVTYLVIWDRSKPWNCGSATQADDSTADPKINKNNGGRGGYFVFNANVIRARGAECLNGAVVAHELIHSMGGVQPDAPHATRYRHCTDGHDLMCVDDGSPESDHAGTDACPDPDRVVVADCNGDDYFNPSQPSGYLRDHWNTADSWWLQTVPRDATLGSAHDGRFIDDDGSVFEDSIEWLAAEDITKGCNPPTNNRFCPDDPVTRGQMAAFLTRALHLQPSAHDRFIDDDDSVFENVIQALAEADITKGCNPPTNNRFCPDDPVTRGQMAAFLNRALS